MTALLLMLLSASGVRAQEVGLDVYRIGRVQCALPPSLPASASVRDGIGTVSLQPRAGLSLDVFDYGWRAAVARGVTAAQFIRVALDPDFYDDFQVIEPLRAGSFQGYPSWSFAFTHTLHARSPRPRSLPKFERYLVVRRRWGFVVVRHTDAAALASDGAADFDALIRGLRLLPEPPGSPRLVLLALLIAAAAAAAALVIRRRARRGPPSFV
ncbi:MAG: hypothetical protein HY552_00370 [Elusimicrobia bacterium]|nr:hypothetical protein [Elusimicrobiota bacterium]